MRQIKLSKKLAIISNLIITTIFLAVISPLKGLSILTFPLILIGIVLWIVSIILLISGLINKQSEKHQKIEIVIALILIISFIPIGFFSMKISGDVRTKIIVKVINRSNFTAKNVKIYGAGNIFENSDTLKINQLNKGDTTEYVTRPNTGPHRTGYIKIEFEADNKHISKNIAGEFSINPYNIQQDWEVILDNKFIK
jgi:glucan phosphoethanolaminetransferase (alkaline phosphatase superfamily)